MNTDVLLTRMSVDSSGKITLPDGMRYRLLVLPESREMTMKTLIKINELVKDGATVLGPRPEKMPGLEGYPGSEDEFKEMVNELWGDLDGISRTIRYVDKGMIAWGISVPDILLKMGIDKDVRFSKELNADVHWIHRCIKDTDIYFISCRSDTIQQIDFSFRINGKQAQRWYPDNGKIEDASFRIIDNRTIVPVKLDPDESVFIVFRENTKEKYRKVPLYSESVIAEINGPWKVNFPAGWGAPDSVEFTDLVSWTEFTSPGIKYFSGTASYTTHVEIRAAWLKSGHPILLDLGKVRDIAEIFINGQEVAALWKAPYKTDIKKYLRPGINLLQIKVTNQWTNRLAGDQLLPDDQKVLDSFIPWFWGKWEPMQSGLMGPVKIMYKHPVKNFQ